MMEQLELLKAAIAIAVADGKIKRSEMGVVEGLALKAGVGKATIDAMMEAASRDETFADEVMIMDRDKAKVAVRLLVAQAKIDGEISSEEREVIIRIADSLNISGDEFHAAYEAGIKRADEVRAKRS